MRRSRARALAAVLCGMALLAAACGGDDGGGDTATGDTVDIDKDVADEVQSQLTSTTAADATTTTAAKAPASFEDWLKLWETERAAVVKKIKDGKFGLSADGKTLTGPGDFKIDLSKCPPGWNNSEGVSATEIVIGHTTAQSGTLADYGNIARAMDTVWSWQNNNGGFKDASGKTYKLRMITKDDGYDSARTIPLVDELIDSDKVFAVWTLGSPNTMKTYDKLNQRCIPQPFSMTGHPAWGDPVNHPWTTGSALAYNTEAILLGSFIDQRIDELSKNDGKVTVGALVMNNDFGKAYDLGFKNYVAQSKNKDKFDYQPELIEPSAPTITDAMTTIRSKNPEVFIAMTAGTSCTQAYVEAAQNGLNESAQLMMTTQPCKGNSFVGKDKAGDAPDGWWIAGGGNRDFNAAIEDNNPFVVWAREELKKAGYDYKSSSSLGLGFAFAWPFWQSLLIAGQLDGGFTRTNLMLAIRSIEMTNPNLLEGIQYNMNGAKDSYPIEGSEFAKYSFAEQRWVQDGAVVELSGKSSNCAWDQSAGVCK